MLFTPSNPEGLPIEVFDEIRAGFAGDRSQYYKELASFTAPTGLARISPKVLSISSGSGGLQDNAYESVNALSETIVTEDLKKFNFPSLGCMERMTDRSGKGLSEEIGPAHWGRQGNLLPEHSARHK